MAFNIIVGMVAAIIDVIIGIEIVSTIASLALLLPSLGLCWRRLHDIGKGGGWYFIAIIPIVGWIILLVWFCKESEMSPNRFGPIPNWENA